MELYSADDLAAIDATVERFCSEFVLPICERAERTMSGEQLRSLHEHAQQLGLLDSGEESGFGLWEQPGDASARAMSLRTLRKVAAVNAGLAFHLHGVALARCLARELALPTSAGSIVCLQGVWGLGRSALPRLLQGTHLGAEDCELLTDYFACAEPRDLLLQAGDAFDHVLLPLFSPTEQNLSFGCFARASLEVERLEASHGLNETHAFRILRKPGVEPAHQSEIGEAKTCEAYAMALTLQAQGLLAIGAGALSLGSDKARQYASMRVQGGAVIERHPAVQALLGKAESTRALAMLSLGALAKLSPGLSGLPASFAARAELHPLLCAAANDALQVFGGLGYMQETGLEKIVRDQNALRLLAGTPAELRRFLAQWSRP